MTQPVTAILSRQGALAARARLFTNDTNEANLLVGRVVSRAFSSLDDELTEVAEESIASALSGDLDRLIDQMRRTRPY